MKTKRERFNKAEITTKDIKRKGYDDDNVKEQIKAMALVKE